MVDKKYIAISTILLFSILNMSVGNIKNNKVKTLTDAESMSNNPSVARTNTDSISDYDTDSTNYSSESINYTDTEDLRDYDYTN